MGRMGSRARRMMSTGRIRCRTDPGRRNAMARPPCSARLLWLPLGILLFAGLALARVGRPDAALRLADAAGALLGALRPELREKAALPFESAARTDWHYVPRERPGVRLREMNDGERKAAHGLLRAALSSRGYLKADSIMQLDRVLRELSIAAGHEDASRDPAQYTFTVFGAPSAESVWGWRV